jgi:peptidoglycan glycosyltransferase
MLGALAVNVTWIQGPHAAAIRAQPGNARTIQQEYAAQRGQILAGPTVLAQSTSTGGSRLDFLRTYPQGPTFAHATGYYSVVYGSSSIERSRNSTLRASTGSPLGDKLREAFNGRPPEGGNVLLTLSPSAQRAAQQAMGSQRGAVVALDPRTGSMYAMWSSPTYDPTKLSSHDASAIRDYYDSLLADEGRPLINRAVNEIYPPGSTAKVIVSAAALSSGEYTPDTVVPSPQRYQPPGTSISIGNYGGGICASAEEATLIEMFRISCNTTFAAIGVKLGDDALRATAEAFGFNSDYDIGIPTTASVFPEDLDPAQTALVSIGGYEMRQTALQAAVTAGTIAKDGERMSPFMVQATTDSQLRVTSRTEPRRLNQAITPEVAADLTRMMQAVVDSGTGRRAQIPGVSVAGKTGTAQRGATQEESKRIPPDAWFLGFAPADNPVVAVGVVVEGGGDMGNEATGGQVSAPIARSVMEAVLKEQGVLR